MKLSFTTKSVAALLATLVFACQPDIETTIDSSSMETPETITSSAVPDQYIIVFNQQKTGNARTLFSDPKQARAHVQNEALRIVRRVAPGFNEKQIAQIYSATINGVAAHLAPRQADALRDDESVAYIEQDQLITLAPKRPGNDKSATEEVPYGVARVNGGATYTGANVAWIIDTGIDLDHEDLNPDASRGFNAFSVGRDAKSLDDNNGHGTHVAGTIAAKDNDTGVVGVAAGATVIPVKVLDGRGSGYYSGVIAGVEHVAANGKSGDVANMSLGGPVSQALDDAVIAASSNGIKFTLAAGNESDDANNYSPARVNGANIYTISAMDQNDKWASFSNFSNPPVDYCAPGVSIKSTYKDGGYASLSGTSMAAPHAAGVLLLGSAKSGGTVIDDPDGISDSIIVH